MKRKKLILLVSLLVVLLAALYAYKEYSRKNADLSKVRPDTRINYADLIREFESNDSIANKKYLGKIIETDGPLKEVEIAAGGFYTLVLGEEGSMSSVRCAIDSTHSGAAAILKVGTNITLRGACTGFKKNELLGENLGADVELNRGVVVLPK